MYGISTVSRGLIYRSSWEYEDLLSPVLLEEVALDSCAALSILVSGS